MHPYAVSKRDFSDYFYFFCQDCGISVYVQASSVHLWTERIPRCSRSDLEAALEDWTAKSCR